jgi:hypothetical protein
MTCKEDMIPLLLDACPGFRPRWEEHLASWNGEAAGVYNDIGEFVAYIIEAFKDGQIECVRAAFDTLEQFLMGGDSEAKERAVIGFIEDLQNASSWESFGAEAFGPFLKPHSLRAWKEVEEMWWGKSSLADVIREEQAGRRRPK